MRPEAAQHADGLRHEAHMPHDGHARPHDRPGGSYPCAAAACMRAAACHHLGADVNKMAASHSGRWWPVAWRIMRPKMSPTVCCILGSMALHGRKDSCRAAGTSLYHSCPLDLSHPKHGQQGLSKKAVQQQSHLLGTAMFNDLLSGQSRCTVLGA